MILEEETFEVFGYYPSDLKHKSAKYIIRVCELCGEFKVLPRFGYRTLCISCVKKGKTRIFTEEHKASLSAAGKGRTLTEAHKANLGAAKKGNKHPMFGKHRTEETKAKISASEKGKIVRDETKALISVASRGRRHTERVKERIGAATRGDKHWNWQGGISARKYCYRFNITYKRKIRARFGNVCFLCGKTQIENGEKLSVHHVNYNKNCGCDNTKCICVPLCKSCHTKTNGHREYWYKKIITKLKSTLLWY
jgi:hypothetical protein